MTVQDRERTLPLRMTEDEFDAWCDEDTRAEFVDGRVFLMSPVHVLHNRASRFLTTLLSLYLEEHSTGELLGPEFQVRLRPGLRRVPDLLFVATEHSERVHETRLEGAPDAAWEIVSPDSEDRDWREKYFEYEASGVREYWIIDPYPETVTLYRLNAEGSYEKVEEEEGRLVSHVVPGFWLRPEWLWQDPTPNVRECLREMGVAE